ncbi:unnamed protein product [Protopolystoma xenopodis]|uniref:Uncharacterized protein n=1 Tax=Protopolystoma xenopodis TaxID=117903 RepID=A0A3S5AG79_9PLAT|nr:unnamed protein product [Protopolystoma xenopodis]
MSQQLSKQFFEAQFYSNLAECPIGEPESPFDRTPDDALSAKVARDGQSRQLLQPSVGKCESVLLNPALPSGQESSEVVAQFGLLVSWFSE